MLGTRHVPQRSIVTGGSVPTTSSSAHRDRIAVPGFADTTNNGGEYKVSVSQNADFPN